MLANPTPKCVIKSETPQLMSWDQSASRHRAMSGLCRKTGFSARLERSPGAVGQGGRGQLCDTRSREMRKNDEPLLSAHLRSAAVVGKSVMPKRRYEILLPAEFNDGCLVTDACPLCIPDSLSEVSDTFGAFTFRPYVALGSWTDACMRYEDRLFLLSIDVDDTAEHRAWIAHFKSPPARAIPTARDLRERATRSISTDRHRARALGSLGTHEYVPHNGRIRWPGHREGGGGGGGGFGCGEAAKRWAPAM